MSATRYLVDDRNVNESAALAIYRALVSWAAAGSERYEITLQPDVYDDPATVRHFRALGEVRSSDTARVTGAPSSALIQALTDQAAPQRATAGDLSPVEDVVFYNGERALYALYDYGRTQVLELTEQELVNLRDALRQRGLDPSVIVVAPPYITGEP